MTEAAHHSGALFHLLGLEVNSITVTSWGIMLVLTLASLLVTRRLQLLPTGRVQVAVELGLESLLNFMGSIMGDAKNARRYFPLLASLFIIILCGNYAGLLPGAGHTPGLQAPTSALSYTAALAVMVFFVTHTEGVRRKGLGYFRHFLQPFPAMLPMTLMEELIKPMSLALRLYGNIYGEETLTASIAGMAPFLLPLPFMFLSVFFGFIQALVFTLLTATYLATATQGH